MTIVKNKIHDKKPKNINKSGTIIEKTKSITILKSKIKKQMNDERKKNNKINNKDERDDRDVYESGRKSIDRNIKIEKIELPFITSTTTSSSFPFIHLKPYLTLTIKVTFHYDSILAHTLYAHTNRSRLLAKLQAAELLQGVRTIFAASALRVNIIFHLNDVKFLKSSNAVPAEANAIKYLEGYCRWQSGFKSKEHYYSILLTGLDIVYYDKFGRKAKKNSGKYFF